MGAAPAESLKFAPPAELPPGTILMGLQAHNTGLRISLTSPLIIPCSGRIGASFRILSLGNHMATHSRAFARAATELASTNFTDGADAIRAFERLGICAPTGRARKLSTPIHCLNGNGLGIEYMPPETPAETPAPAPAAKKPRRRTKAKA